MIYKQKLITLMTIFSFMSIGWGCDEGYTELLDIPESVTVTDSSNCFFQSDLDVLQHLISINIETSNPYLDENNNGNIEPLELGRQEWNEGRLFVLECLYFDNEYNDWISCNLSGQLTSSIGNLDQIQSIIFKNNQFSGELPPEIGNLSQLKILYLQNNSITSIPPEISNLGNLEFLLMDSNELTILPENIGSMSNLISLSFHYNQLTEIPESIVELSNLSYLGLIGNYLTTIPENICDLNIDWGFVDCSGYYYFDISFNQICPPYPICDEFQITSEYFQYTSECVECSDTLGDLNDDGIVNIIDIVDMVNCILSDNRCDICYDISGDGFVDVVDIVDLVNIILDN